MLYTCMPRPIWVEWWKCKTLTQLQNFGLNKLFISRPICRTLFFHPLPQAKYLFLFLGFFYRQSWIPKQTQQLFEGLCKFKGHYRMPSEAGRKIFFSLKSHKIKTNKKSIKYYSSLNMKSTNQQFWKCRPQRQFGNSSDWRIKDTRLFWLGFFAEPLFPHIRIRKLPAPDVSLGKYLYQRVYTQQRLHFCGVQMTNMLPYPRKWNSRVFDL